MTGNRVPMRPKEPAMRFHLPLRHAGAAALAGLLAGGALAQAKVIGQPNTRAPAAAVQAAPAVAPGAPAPAGLASTSPFPQGLPSPLPAPAGTPPGAMAQQGTAAPAAVGGTGVAGGPGVPAGAQTVPSGNAGYSTTQIALSFRQADANLDGELTRAEATRLTIMPLSFEEVDRNKDGILSRSEYEDGLR
jgi:hypothetical protein